MRLWKGVVGGAGMVMEEKRMWEGIVGGAAIDTPYAATVTLTSRI